ncbi:hypothetical protein [Nocardia barduliensis]|uniref:hypothetical protein n=1 Tax=Nocardia barduliensis TaxID=2736643 RepID=UPI001574BE7B|nr:hypothetical protein [Nocardia barduliensis]
MTHRKNPGDDPWAWLDQPRTGPDLRLVPSLDPGLDSETGAEPGSRLSVRRDRWLVAVAQTPDAPDTGVGVLGWIDARKRVSWRVWAALAASVAVLIGVVAVWASDTRDAGDPVRATAVPPSATSTAEGACTGLAGAVVTDRRADTTATVAGVIAAFEAAYYIDRNAETAMRLLAPESGITADGLAAGIASIPLGTIHCVAVTPISESTANVHVVELRPDRQRMDYLQLINTRPGESGGLLISNVQRQG